jgi:hypothetical protein
MRGFTINNLLDGFVLHDRRLGETGVQVFIRPSGYESYGIRIPVHLAIAPIIAESIIGLKRHPNISCVKCCNYLRVA